MTWREKIQPKEGDLRLRTRWLWTPLTISKLTKFWELGTWVEQCIKSPYHGCLEWAPIAWREPLNLPADGKGWRTFYRRIFSRTQTQDIHL